MKGADMADAKATLPQGLNIDLQGEFQAIITYPLYASMVQGPYRQALRAFFAGEIPEELGHAEVDTIASDVRRRIDAEATEEHGLVADLDQVIADETKHRDDLRQMLARWP
jgi:bacterioferritin